VTGKLHFFSYGAEGAPYVTYGCASAEGVVEKTLPIDIPRPIMMHDFAITEHFSVFMDLPLCFDPQVWCGGTGRRRRAGEGAGGGCVAVPWSF
jgi:carotenoid cleavage dioxygenase